VQRAGTGHELRPPVFTLSLTRVQKKTSFQHCAPVAFFNFFIRSVGGGVQLGPLDTAATDTATITTTTTIQAFLFFYC
jgi:hypothetical protein